MMRIGKIITILCFLLIPSSFAQKTQEYNLKNQTFTAKVIRILDGDTMEILYDSKPIKIRLAHIDCPEKRGSQPFGNNAKIALSNLCFAQKVTVQAQNYDRNKRLIAIIINQKKKNVNQEMVKLGMAWHFKKYSKDATYTKLEDEARKKKIGLWKDPNPIAPWSWRSTPKEKK